MLKRLAAVLVAWVFFALCVWASIVISKPAKPVRTAADVKAERAAVAKLTERVRNIVLMDLPLPNGKKLRNSTFKECSLAGGWFKLLACKGKPSEIVGKVLTEDDLRTLK